VKEKEVVGNGERYSLHENIGRVTLWDNLKEVYIPLEDMPLEIALKVALVNQLISLKEKLSGVVR
jgi:hypothetical protein